MKTRLMLIIAALMLLLCFILTSCDPSAIIDGMLGEGELNEGPNGEGDDGFGDEEGDGSQDGGTDDLGGSEEEGENEGTDEGEDENSPDLSLKGFNGIEISLGWYDEQKSEYTISSESELCGLGYLSSHEGISFEGKTITLTADLDLTSSLYIRIGASADAPFRGRFVGGGHKIKLEAREESITEIPFCANDGGISTSLFAYNEGLISEIIFDSCTVKLPLLTKSGATYNLSILAEVNSGRIQDCSVSGAYMLAIPQDNQSLINIGAICSENYGSIEGSSVTATKIEVQFSSAEATGLAASVAAQNLGIIKECRSDAEIVIQTCDTASETLSLAGGIAAEMKNKDYEAERAKIDLCSFEGKISASVKGADLLIGGIAAEIQSCGISECEALFDATVSSDGKAEIGAICAKAVYDLSLPTLVMSGIANSAGKINLLYNEKSYTAENSLYSSDMTYLKNDNLYSQFSDNYYYNTLSDDEKAFYAEVYTWLVEAGNYPFYYDYNEKLSLGPVSYTDRGLTDEDIAELALIIRLDNPELFYIDLTYGIYSYGEEKFVEFIVDDRYLDTYDMNAEGEALDRILDEVIRASENMSEYDKIRYVYDYVIAATEYDDTYVFDSNYSISGSLLYGCSVCTGYSYAFKYLCDGLGIKALVIASDEMVHAWNAVKLGGAWYFVDVTWADTAERDFFLQGSDEFMSEDGADDTHYAINGYLLLPEFSSESYK